MTSIDTHPMTTAFAPRIFKATSTAVFLLGAVIHVGRMLYGLEAWTRDVFTPPVDIAFGALIVAPAVTGAMSWTRYTGGWPGRIVYTFAMILLVISVPLHLKTIFTWSTEYLNAFPFWYSAIEVPMFLGLSYVMTQLKFARTASP
jgi:hypothetical protein